MLRFVSLFSGAGGLDLGLEHAGWMCDFAADVDSAAVETLRANKGRKTGGKRALENTLVERVDIRDLSGKMILSRIGRRRGDISLLAGGPPCQSFSSAGHQLGFDDPRGRLFEDYVRISKQLDPRWLIFENVRGLVTARGADGIPGSALQHIRGELARSGWQTHVDLLNAADFGVPQRRVRLVLIGFRAGDAPAFPAPTHAEPSEIFRRSWVTLGQCLERIRPPDAGEIIRPNEKLAAELSKLHPGSGVKSPGKRETTRPGGHWGYKQGAFVADLEKPARTVTANSQQDWIVDKATGLRRLSPRECAAIQSFPPCWQFTGSRGDQYRLVGNAVPPLLAKHLGTALLQHAHKKVTESKQVTQHAVVPLPQKLQAAITYTMRDEARNGASRREADPKRAASIKPATSRRVC